MRRIANCLFGLVVLLTIAGCSDKPASQASTSWIDSSITRFHPLGWLGGRAHPATRTVEVTDDEGAESAVGGMVVTEVDSDGPLGAAGVVLGDVIVRVGNTWLPNKDDPSMDLIRAIEAEVSARVRPIELSVLRKGRVEKLHVQHDVEPMEVGLPAASQRLNRIADAGLRKLAEMQNEDGSFGDAGAGVDQQLATCSIAGLAFLAAADRDDDNPYAEALDRCHSHVASAIADKDTPIGAWALAWATTFLAEHDGPLELKLGESIQLGGAMPVFRSGEGQPIQLGAGSESSGHPGGTIVRSFSFSSDGDVPEGVDLEELKKQGNLKVMVLGSGGSIAGMTPPSAGAVAKTEMPDEPLWTIDQIKLLAGDEALERIGTSLKAVERLVALQRESGGWDAPDETVGYSERTLVTNQVLMALGMAQRAGTPVAGTVLRRGLAYLRTSTNDGHVFAVSDEGFDRRLEAGRSGGAGAALMALNCSADDEFLRELAEFNDKHARTISEADSGVPLHVLNTAIFRRQRGRAAWAAFFEEFRDLIVSLQRRDGTFDQLPSEKGGSTAAYALSSDEATRTAVWSLVAALQGDHTTLLIAKAGNPLQREITSDGKLVAGMAPPAAAQAMDPEQIRKLLESMGGDLDEVMQKALKQSGDEKSDKP